MWLKAEAEACGKINVFIRVHSAFTILCGIALSERSCFSKQTHANSGRHANKTKSPMQNPAGKSEHRAEALRAPSSRRSAWESFTRKEDKIKKTILVAERMMETKSK